MDILCILLVLQNKELFFPEKQPFILMFKKECLRNLLFQQSQEQMQTQRVAEVQEVQDKTMKHKLD